jgi:hypothetical protein
MPKPRAPFHGEDMSDTEVSQLTSSSVGELGSFECLILVVSYSY